MKYKKLFELYELLKKAEVDMTDNLESFINLTDEEIDLVLTSKYPEYAFYMVQDFQTDFSKAIIKSINNSSNKEIARLVYEVTTADETQGIASELCDAISHATLPQANYALIFINSEELNEVFNPAFVTGNDSECHTDLCELVDIMCNIKNAEIAEMVYNLVLDKRNIQERLSLELARMFSQVEDVDLAKVAYGITTNEQIRELYASEFMELIKKVLQIKEERMTTIIGKIVSDKEVIDTRMLMELVDTILTAKGITQATYAAEVASNKDVLHYGLSVCLAKAVSQATSEYQASYAAKIACSPCILKSDLGSGKILQLVRAASTIDDGQILSISQGFFTQVVFLSASEPDNSYLYDMFTIETNFWDMFEVNSDEAMKLLSESITSEDDEINVNTKVRRKLKKEEPKKVSE